MWLAVRSDHCHQAAEGAAYGACRMHGCPNAKIPAILPLGDLIMNIRLLLLATITAPLWAQGGRGGPQNREAPVTPVPFERILANRNPRTG